MNLNDVIDNVLVDGAPVEAVDFKSWSAQILKSGESNKLKVLQSELDDKVQRKKTTTRPIIFSHSMDSNPTSGQRSVW